MSKQKHFKSSEVETSWSENRIFHLIHMNMWAPELTFKWAETLIFFSVLHQVSEIYKYIYTLCVCNKVALIGCIWFHQENCCFLRQLSSVNPRDLEKTQKQAGAPYFLALRLDGRASPSGKREETHFFTLAQCWESSNSWWEDHWGGKKKEKNIYSLAVC